VNQVSWFTRAFSYVPCTFFHGFRVDRKENFSIPHPCAIVVVTNPCPYLTADWGTESVIGTAGIQQSPHPTCTRARGASDNA
jgi:hypothetical protein